MREQEWLHQPDGGLDPATYAQAPDLGPAPEAEQAAVLAVFTNAEAARACFRNLQAREVRVSLEAVDDGTPAAEAQLRERAMGRGVVLGATVGATAGFLAGTYLVPPGSATATGTMLTTLAGAGLGCFIGSLADTGGRAEGAAPAGARRDDGAQAGRWRLVCSVDRAHAGEVMDLIAPWKPEELRVE